MPALVARNKQNGDWLRPPMKGIVAIFESIFQRFDRGQAGKTGDSSGSGLGLAVVDRLVEEFGLAIDVYSEFGRDSAFHLLVRPRCSA